MGKFRMIFWCEGPFESNEGKKELDAESMLMAKKQAENIIEELKKSHPLFDFGLAKLSKIGKKEETADVPPES